MTGRTLVAGVGNIFLGDDGFGPEVARRLAGAGLPEGVRVADYGTSGMHLAYDLTSGYDSAVLVDAAPRGQAPGTVTVLEAVLPGQDDSPGPPAPDPVDVSRFFDGHGMPPDVVLSVLGRLGRPAPRILVVCCEPARVDYRMELSEPVAAAVDDAVKIIIGLFGE
jgi:hydrogenase maturation protease